MMQIRISSLILAEAVVSGARLSLSADLADPMADVREVIETFRCHEILLDGWREELTRAAEALADIDDKLHAHLSLNELGRRIRRLAIDGLDQQPQLVEEVAQEVGTMLSRSRVSGIPRPEDNDWEF